MRYCNSFAGQFDLPTPLQTIRAELGSGFRQHACLINVVVSEHEVERQDGANLYDLAIG